jgi:uncharacterized membrane protein YgdD (TMEM256/DUF423 family)
MFYFAIPVCFPSRDTLLSIPLVISPVLIWMCQFVFPLNMVSPSPSPSSLPSNLRLLQYASILGSTGIAAGAFGAHLWKESLQRKPNGVAIWNTGVLYHLMHSVAMLGVYAISQSASSPTSSTSLSRPSSATCRLAGDLMISGVCMFSGSLYCLALDVGPKALLGPSTPLGGLVLMGSWLVLGFKR